MRVMYDSWKEHLNSSGKSDSEPLVMPWLLSKPFRQQHPERVKDIKTNFTQGYLSKNSKAYERQAKANITTDTRGRLHRIDRPTLIMVGKHDELTPPTMAKELESELPNAKLMIFDQGGHGLYWEVPQLFNQSVVEFLNGKIS